MIWGVIYVLGTLTGKDSTVQTAGLSTENPLNVPNVIESDYSPGGLAVGTLREYHAMFDRMVASGGIDNFSPENNEAWDNFLTSEVFNSQQYHTISSRLADVQGLNADMGSLIKLSRIARENHDPEALRYMHRILHDLDFYAFPRKEAKSSEFWGITQTVPSKDSASSQALEDYIANN